MTSLTLPQIRSPEPLWINSAVLTEGYFQAHDEEDLLTSEKERFRDEVELSFAPMLASIPKEARREWRATLGERLDGKLVKVRGIMRVGPFGMLNRTTVYLEVEDISEVENARATAH